MVMNILRCGAKKKFIVLNIEHLQDYASSDNLERLKEFLQDYSCELPEEKRQNEYLVINTDEPYAEEIIEILKRNGHWS